MNNTMTEIDKNFEMPVSVNYFKFNNLWSH